MRRIRAANDPIRIFIFTLAWKAITLTEIFAPILRIVLYYLNEFIKHCCTVIYGLKHYCAVQIP